MKNTQLVVEPGHDTSILDGASLDVDVLDHNDISDLPENGRQPAELEKLLNMTPRSSKIDEEKMKAMMSDGFTPEDIRKTFGIAISTVHNYKKKFKAEGLELESQRGRRPMGVKSTPKPPPKETFTAPKAAGMKTMTFIINNVTVRLEGPILSVNVTDSEISIKY